jgi:hypothetical protein
MSQPFILYGSLSWCCNAGSIIVRSRDNGFVTQNCQSCGKPRALQPHEVPDMYCRRCSIRFTKGRDKYRSYLYWCDNCGVEVLLADLVPSWSELFDYWGYEIEQQRIQRV